MSQFCGPRDGFRSLVIDNPLLLVNRPARVMRDRRNGGVSNRVGARRSVRRGRRLIMNMTRKFGKFRAASAALIVVALSLAVYWLSRGLGSPVGSEVEQVAQAESDIEVHDLEAAPERPLRPREEVEQPEWERLGPMPDASAPLADQLPALLLRAEAGDPTASCRLIIGINRCREESRNRRFSERMRNSLEARAGENDSALVEIVARSEEQRESSGGYCSGASALQVPRIDDIFRNALHSLSARQKTILALTRSDGSIRQLHDSVSFTESGLYVMPQFIADHTVEFLMAGYHARDPLALEGLVMLHSPGNSISPRGVGVWLPNPRLFLQYSMLMQELFGADALGTEAMYLMRATAATMAPDDLERVRRAVILEARQWSTAQSKYLSKDGRAIQSKPRDYSDCEA